MVANASTDLDGTGTVSVACTKGVSATVGSDSGRTPRGHSSHDRWIRNFLTYELYQDASHTTVWGDAGAGLLSPAAAPSKAARNFTVYGQVVSNQDATAGSYSDTVVATVNFSKNAHTADMVAVRQRWTPVRIAGLSWTCWPLAIVSAAVVVLASSSLASAATFTVDPTQTSCAVPDDSVLLTLHNQSD